MRTLFLVLVMTLVATACDTTDSGGPRAVMQADSTTMPALSLPLAPITTIVFRPGDPAGSRWNVYTKWKDAYAAIERVRGLGQIYLEFDTTYGEVHIPAGQWLMNEVIWTDLNLDARETRVTLDDGASIQITTTGSALQVVGNTIAVVSDRTGPVAPFVGVNLVLGGAKALFYNTSPTALPAFVVTPGGANFIAFKDCPFGGVGNGARMPAPIIDTNGGTFVAGGFSGHINDNAVTGAGTLVMRMASPNFNGGLSPAETNDFPAFTGTVATQVRARDRMRVESVVTATTYNAQYGELVRVDSSLHAVTVTAPKARPPSGDRFTVKDVGRHADTNPIAVVNQDGETLEGGTIGIPGQAKTWVSDGGTWLYVGSN